MSREFAMRRALCAVVRRALPLALVLLATAAHAAPGVNLRWSQCFGDGGIQNRNFACNTNSGSEVLVCSFVLAADLAQASEVDTRIDIVTQGTTLPAWWEFKNPGTCRLAALAINTSPPPAAVNCTDWASGQAVALISSYNVGINFIGPNSARILAVSVVSPDALQPLSAGTEYFSASLTISHIKTVGTGACDGCTVPACIVFSAVNVTVPPPGFGVTLFSATNGTDSYFATWQGGTVFHTGGVDKACPYPVATKRSTWGALRALYR